MVRSVLVVPILLLITVGGGCAGPSVDPKKAIVGEWTEQPGGQQWSFSDDGTATCKAAEGKGDKDDKWTYRFTGTDGIDMTSTSTGQTKPWPGQYRFNGANRLVILLDSHERPTRMDEAAKAAVGTMRLSGKGGGQIIKLERK